MEFEVYHFWAYVQHTKKESIDWITKLLGAWGEKWLPFRKVAFNRYVARLDRVCAPFLSSTLPGEELLGMVTDAVKIHDEWLFSLPRSYGRWSTEPAPTIVITESPMFGGYYGWAGDDLAVISVSGWERRYAPPSALEYVLRNVQRYSLRLTFGEAVGSHYPTRGCAWDFNASLVGIGAGILIGYMCSACEEGLRLQIDQSAIADVKKWLSQDWVGRVDDTGSVASNIKRVFGYDLARTKGLTRGFWDRMSEILTSESAKWLVVFLLGALATWLVGRGRSSPPIPPK